MDVIPMDPRRWEALAERVMIEEAFPDRAAQIRRVWDGLVERHGGDLDADRVGDAMREELDLGAALRVIAHHEAAHAVVGLAAGRPVHHVSAGPYDPDDRTWGRAGMGGESVGKVLERAMSQEPDAARETMAREAAIHAAGPVAGYEAEHGRAPGPGWRDELGEMELARDVLLAPVARDAAEADELLERAVRRARGVLAANRDLHDALVAELLQRRRLRERDLARVLARHPVSMVPEGVRTSRANGAS